MTLTNKYESGEQKESLQVQGSDDPQVEALQKENKSYLPNLQKKQDFERMIDSQDSLEAQKKIAEFLKKNKNHPLFEELFRIPEPNKKSLAEKLFATPDILTIKTAEETLKKNENRIKRIEQLSGEKFSGKTLEDIATAFGKYYEGKIIAQTAPPGKDIFKKIGQPGKVQFRWTEKETQKNLAWKKKLLERGGNPLEFMDWFEKNMKETAVKRDKQITEWAGDNVKTAKKNPQVFSQKYLAKLEEIHANLKSGKPNNFPIELLQDFENLVMKEQLAKRLQTEKEIAKKFDEQEKLIGAKNVKKWKAGWIKEAPIDDLNKWFKNGEFDTEIARLNKQKEDFESQIKDLPETEKEQSLKFFWSLNGEEREMAFEEIQEKLQTLKDTNADAFSLVINKTDFFTKDELKSLQNIADLPSQTEKNELVENSKRLAEKREHILTKANVRKKHFEKDIAEYDKGVSLKELGDILKPIQEIYNEMQTENCPMFFDLNRDFEEAKNKYEEKENGNSFTEEDFITAFLEDHTVSTLLLAHVYEAKKEFDGKSESKKDNKEAIEKNQETEQYEEALESYAQEKTEDTAVRQEVYNFETDTLQNSEFLQDSVHEDVSFQNKYNEAQERKQEEILQSNRSLDSQVKDVQSRTDLVVNLDDYRKENLTFTVDTETQILGIMKSGEGSVSITDDSKQERSVKDETRKKKTGNIFTNWANKAFREKEAKKASNASKMVKNLNDMRNKFSGKDTNTADKTKLAKELYKGWDKAA